MNARARLLLPCLAYPGSHFAGGLENAHAVEQQTLALSTCEFDGSMGKTEKGGAPKLKGRLNGRKGRTAQPLKPQPGG